MPRQTPKSVPEGLAAFVTSELRRRADPGKAGPMAAYVKTAMPFYGVQKPGREEISKALWERFSITSRRDYEKAVRTLWLLPHREEKYFAIGVARHCDEFVTPRSLKLYERLIREGAWWDFVDGVAIDLVGKVLLENRGEVSPLMDRWVDDPDMWIRRSAIICQIGHKEKTDHRRLFRYCLLRCEETEFFIRKGIGWALRDYSYAAPERVLDFLKRNKGKLSPLSFREGAKVLKRTGYRL